MSNEAKFKLAKNTLKIFLPKTCASCGESFKRPVDMQATRWRAKKTCSAECTSAKRKDDARIANELRYWEGCLDDKPCATCGANMSNGDKISNYAFIRKLTCSNKCATALRKINRPTGYKRKSSLKDDSSIAWHWEQRSTLVKLIHGAISRPLLEK